MPWLKSLSDKLHVTSLLPSFSHDLLDVNISTSLLYFLGSITEYQRHVFVSRKPSELNGHVSQPMLLNASLSKYDQNPSCSHIMSVEIRKETPESKPSTVQSLAKTVATVPLISTRVLLFCNQASIPLCPFSTPSPLFFHPPTAISAGLSPQVFTQVIPACS